MACSMSRPVEADRETGIEVDEDEQICSPYHNSLASATTVASLGISKGTLRKAEG